MLIFLTFRHSLRYAPQWTIMVYTARFVSMLAKGRDSTSLLKQTKHLGLRLRLRLRTHSLSFHSPYFLVCVDACTVSAPVVVPDACTVSAPVVMPDACTVSAPVVVPDASTVSAPEVVPDACTVSAPVVVPAACTVSAPVVVPDAWGGFWPVVDSLTTHERGYRQLLCLTWCCRTWCVWVSNKPANTNWWSKVLLTLSVESVTIGG